MKLTDDWRIEQKSDISFSLIRTVDGKDKDGNAKKKDTEYYYGTLYQALQGFLVKASQEEQNIEAVHYRIMTTLDSLRLAKDKIKSAFKTEVRETK